jgi:hypothetical protein
MQALIKPRLNIAARPYPAPGMLRIALGPGIFALRILGPVERKAIANQPFAETEQVATVRPY